MAVRRNADSAEIVALGETLLEVNARHGRLIDGLLLLTRAEPEVSSAGIGVRVTRSTWTTSWLTDGVIRSSTGLG